jgi:hypothetical protein
LHLLQMHKSGSSRIADLYAKRSEGPVSALNVEMCMAQHLSLSAYSVEKLLLIWVLTADSVSVLILEIDRDDGTTPGSTICSFL